MTDRVAAEASLKPIIYSENSDDPEYVDSRCRALLFYSFLVGTTYRGHRGVEAGRMSYEAFAFAQRIRDMKGLIGFGEPVSRWSVKELSRDYQRFFGGLMFPEQITSTSLFQEDMETCALVIQDWTVG